MTEIFYEKVSGVWTLKNRLSPKVFGLDTTTPFVQVAAAGACTASRFDTGGGQIYVCINSKFAKASS